MRHRLTLGLNRALDPVAARAAGYVALLLAGVVTVSSPSKIIESTLGGQGFWQVFWSGLLIAGSVLSLYGVIRRVWWGEFAGLLGVMFSLGVYCLAAWIPPTTASRVAVGCMVAGLSCILFSRWRDVRTLQAIPKLPRSATHDK